MLGHALWVYSGWVEEGWRKTLSVSGIEVHEMVGNQMGIASPGAHREQETVPGKLGLRFMQ